MTLGEIIRIRKFKNILILLCVLIVSVLVFPNTLLTDKTNDYLSEQLASNEFFTVMGHWKVTEYLGAAIEYHGAEITMEEEQREHDEIVAKTIEKYIGKMLMIDTENVVGFYPPDEMGYHYDTWDDLFFRFRPAGMTLEGMSPPFLCAYIELKDFDEYMHIIMDCNSGEMVLTVRGEFFKLERI